MGPFSLWSSLIALLAALCSVLVGLFSLLGWGYNLPLLIRLAPGQILINPVVSVALILGGMSLALLVSEAAPEWQKRLGRFLAGLLFLNAALGFLDFLLGGRVGINFWLFPVRMEIVSIHYNALIAFSSVVCLLLIATALLLLDSPVVHRRFLAQVFVLVSAGITLLALTGYAFSSTLLVRVPFIYPMSFNTALSVFLLSLGILICRPYEGLMAIFTTDSLGGTMARRTVPLMLFAPLVVGWLRLRGEQIGYYPGPFGVALLATSCSLLATSLIWWNAILIDQEEQGRLRAETALRASEEKYAKAFRLNPSMMSLTRPENGCFLEVNDTMLHRLGFQRDEVIGKTSLELAIITPEARSKMMKQLDEKGVIRNLEIQVFTKAHDMIEGLMSGEVFELAGTKYLIISVLDIGQQKAYQRGLETRTHELERQRDFIQRILDNIPAQIVYLDRNLVYLISNPFNTRRMGVGELVGKHLYEALPGSEVVFGPILKSVFETGKPFVGHSMRVSYFIGTQKVEQVNDVTFYPVFGEQHQVEGVLMLAVDVSERVEKERLQREQLDTLMKADRVKDEFISVISHELRTPLNAVIGFGSFLEDEIAGPLNEKQHEFVAKLLKGGDRMLVLIDDLLDYARIQAGRFDVAEVETDYPSLVEEAVASFEPMASEKSIRIESEVTVSEPVCVDRRRIIQVIANFLSNAIKFTPSGGRIRVRACLYGGKLVTEVTDNGIGIEPEDLSKLFLPFKQLDMSLTRKVGGVGLGLSISKAIIEAHGGQIAVESEGAGKGSTFWFEIPQD